MYSQHLRAAVIVGLLLSSSISDVMSFAWAQDTKFQLGESKPEVPAITLAAKFDVLITFDENGSTLTFDWDDKKPALAVVKSFLTLGKWNLVDCI